MWHCDDREVCVVMVISLAAEKVNRCRLLDSGRVLLAISLERRETMG